MIQLSSGQIQEGKYNRVGRKQNNASVPEVPRVTFSQRSSSSSISMSTSHQKGVTLSNLRKQFRKKNIF